MYFRFKVLAQSWMAEFLSLWLFVLFCIFVFLLCFVLFYYFFLELLCTICYTKNSNFCHFRQGVAVGFWPAWKDFPNTFSTVAGISYERKWFSFFFSLSWGSCNSLTTSNKFWFNSYSMTSNFLVEDTFKRSRHNASCATLNTGL